MDVHTIEVAGTPLQIQYDKRNKALEALFALFPSGNVKGSRQVTIYQSSKNGKSLSDDLQSMQLYMQFNPADYEFYYYGLVQAVLRFAGLHLPEAGKYLLHGSCVSLPGFGGILFADDDGLFPGRRSVKTSPSLEMALAGARFLGDEFSILNALDGSIDAFFNVPIHIRLPEILHFRKVHDISLAEEEMLCYAEQFHLQHGTASPLRLIIYCHPGQQAESQLLGLTHALEAFQVTLTAHLAKFINPSLDRLRFDIRSDHTDATDINSEKEKILRQFPALHQAMPVLNNVPSFQLTTPERCTVTAAIQKIASRVQINEEVS